MNKILILALSLSLAACTEQKPYQFYYEHPKDTQVEAYILDMCLKAATGPTSTRYNDWDEAIKACGSNASNMARYCPAQDMNLCQTQFRRTREDVRMVLPKELR